MLYLYKFDLGPNNLGREFWHQTTKELDYKGRYHTSFKMSSELFVCYRYRTYVYFTTYLLYKLDNTYILGYLIKMSTIGIYNYLKLK